MMVYVDWQAGVQISRAWERFITCSRKGTAPGEEVVLLPPSWVPSSALQSLSQLPRMIICVLRALCPLLHPGERELFPSSQWSHGGLSRLMGLHQATRLDEDITQAMG